MIIYPILTICIFFISIFFWRKIHKIEEKLKKYEFENRTDGGSIFFKSYEESKKHERKKRIIILYYFICAIPLILSFFIFFIMALNGFKI